MKNESVNGILERVQKIIIRQLGVETSLLTSNARFREDLGADSLDLVELVIALALEFGGILDEDTREIQTVGELVIYIERGVKLSAG